MNYLFRKIGLPHSEQLERFLFNAQDLIDSYVTPRVVKTGFALAGSRPYDLGIILEKWTLQYRQTNKQLEAIKNAIEGIFSNHWNTLGHGDLPDNVICESLRDVVPPDSSVGE